MCSTEGCEPGENKHVLECTVSLSGLGMSKTDNTPQTYSAKPAYGSAPTNSYAVAKKYTSY